MLAKVIPRGGPAELLAVATISVQMGGQTKIKYVCVLLVCFDTLPFPTLVIVIMTVVSPLLNVHGVLVFRGVNNCVNSLGQVRAFVYCLPSFAALADARMHIVDSHHSQNRQCPLLIVSAALVDNRQHCCLGMLDAGNHLCL